MIKWQWTQRAKKKEYPFVQIKHIFGAHCRFFRAAHGDATPELKKRIVLLSSTRGVDRRVWVWSLYIELAKHAYSFILIGTAFLLSQLTGGFLRAYQ